MVPFYVEIASFWRTDGFLKMCELQRSKESELKQIELS